MLRLLSIVVVILLFSSCGTIYGLKKNRALTRERVSVLDRRYNIPHSALLQASYAQCVNAAQLSTATKSNHKQPLQIWVYEHNSLVYYNLNCYAGGIPNLRWSFPESPGQLPQLKRDGQLSFAGHMQCLDGSGNDPGGAKYRIVVIWSEWMGRQNKRFLKQVADNFGGWSNARLYYFNADNLFAAP